MPKPIEITRASGTVWRVRFRIAGIESCKTFVTETDAKWFCEQIETHGVRVAVTLLDAYEDEVGDGPRDTSPYLSAVADEWLEWKSHRVRDPQTIEDYRTTYRLAIKPTFGARPVASITVADIEDWIERHVDGKIISKRTGKKLSNKTIRDRQNVLKQILDYAADPKRSYITTNPAKTKIDLPKRVKPAPKGLMPAQWQRLEAKMIQFGYDDAHDLAAFLIGSGWRIGEAMALSTVGVEDYGTAMWVTMSRVVRRDGTIVEGSGKSDSALRRIKVDATTASIIRDRCAAARHDDLVFTQASGAPWTNRQFAAILQRCAKAAGLGHITPHHLRHTHVAWLAMSNAPLAELQRRIGHASISTTIGVYGRMIGDVSDGTIDAFAAMRDAKPSVTASSPAKVIEGSTVAS